MANVKFSDFPSVTVAGAATQGVGLQAGANVRYAMGTAAAENAGNSGHVLPFLDAANVWTGNQSLNGGLSVGDGNFSMSLPSGVPTLTMAASDTITYDRTNDLVTVTIGGSKVAQIGNGNSFLIGPQTRTSFVVAGPTRAVRTGFSSTSTFVEGVDNTGGNVSYQPLSLSGSVVRMCPSGDTTTGISVNATSVAVNNTYMTIVDVNYKLSNDGTAPAIQFDVGDRLFFDRTTNAHSFQVGNSTVASILANGGFANFQANDTNLSDATLKKDITPYSNAMLDELEASFRAINWCKYRFKNQDHNDWNYGYIAQDVEKAFAKSAPGMVDEVDKHKVVYDNDLVHIALAVLSRALKRIDELERVVKGKR